MRIQRKKQQTSRALVRQNQVKRPAQPVHRAGLRPKAASDVERLMRIERRKARNRAVGMSILVLFIMLLTTLMIIMVMNRTKPRPRFMFIQEGSVSHTVRSNGLILRDEVVFSASASGIVKPLATEGSRVAKGQKVAMIIPEDQQEKLRELQKYDQDIVELQIELMNSGKGAGARAIYEETNAAMTSVVNLIRSDVVSGDLSGMSSYASSLSVLIDQRSTRLLPVDFQDARIDQLKNSKAQLELSLGLNHGTMICQEPGIVSFRLDGLETEVNSELAQTITVGQYKDFLSRSSRQTANQAVAADEPVLRITGGLHQAIVFVIDEAGKAYFEEGDLQNLIIPKDGVTIPDCEVVRSTVVDGSNLVVFETDRRVDWFADRRQVEAELTLASTSGMKVPMISLIDYNAKNQAAGIMIVTEGFTRIAPVKVVDHDKDFAIIEAVEYAEYKPEISSILVVNPASIEEGELIAD